MGIGLADDVALDHHVLHDEVGPIERVGHDASHESGRQHHGLGAFLVEKALHGLLVGQVERLMAAPNKVGIAPMKQVVPDGRAHQAMMTRYIDLAVFIHTI